MKKTSTTIFISALEAEFSKKANATVAAGQKAYMRNQFEFYGLKTELRRAIQKPFLVKEFLPSKKEMHVIVKTLWKKPQREFQLFAQELVSKYVKQFDKNDIALLEFMITHKSWWDTVDFIAVNVVGKYLKMFPEEIKRCVKHWLASNNIWLQRTALLFQLKYKTEMNTALLSANINALLGSKEFFINKAIGWVLREYSKTNPAWV